MRAGSGRGVGGRSALVNDACRSLAPRRRGQRGEDGAHGGRRCARSQEVGHSVVRGGLQGHASFRREAGELGAGAGGQRHAHRGRVVKRAGRRRHSRPAPPVPARCAHGLGPGVVPLPAARGAARRGGCARAAGARARRASRVLRSAPPAGGGRGGGPPPGGGAGGGGPPPPRPCAGARVARAKKNAPPPPPSPPSSCRGTRCRCRRRTRGRGGALSRLWVGARLYERDQATDGVAAGPLPPPPLARPALPHHRARKGTQTSRARARRAGRGRPGDKKVFSRPCTVPRAGRRRLGPCPPLPTNTDTRGCYCYLP